MPLTTSTSAEAARELLRKNAALTKRLRELGVRGTAAAAALARPGAPPTDDLVRALGDAGQEFAALRGEVYAAAAALGLQTPAMETIDSTRRLDAILKVLLDGLDRVDKQAAAQAALSQTVAVLDRIASLAHREDPAFSALLTLMDGQQNIDDEQWGVCEDQVATAFGRALAVAATRGKLVKR